jgi:hypothetical protein
MKNKFMQTTVGTFLALLMLFGGTQIFVSGQESENGDLQEEQDKRYTRRSIEGVWQTAVTPRNCQTGVPVAPVIPGLFTFHEGGTMSEYGISPGQMQTPALRSPGHGVWKREFGWHNYSFAFIFYRYDASGIFIGTQKVTATLALGTDGNGFTTSSSVQIFDANGNQIGTGCATAVGTRFE